MEATDHEMIMIYLFIKKFRPLDVERPLMSCPYNIHATSSKGKATAKVLWSIQVTDNSVEVDPNAVIRVQSSHESGQEFPIGDTLIRVNATDETGNTETCVFNIHVIGNWLIYSKILRG